MLSFKKISNACLVGSFLLALFSLVHAEDSFSSLPKVTKIWVGTEKALVTSAENKEYYSTNDVEIQLLAKNGEWIEKGRHWATLNPENLNLERESLELEKKKKYNN